jgi:hypothetical protein
MNPDEHAFERYSLHLAWSYVDHYTALQDYLHWEPDKIKEVREAFLENWVADGLLQLDDDDINSIFVFAAVKDRVPVVMRQIYTEALDAINEIGADDGFYDYYPDLIGICNQLTLAITSALPTEAEKYAKTMNWVRQTAVNFRYYENAEALELVGGNKEDLAVRDQYLRRSWLAPVPVGQYGYKYTQKFREAMDPVDLDIPDWMFLP